MTVDLLSVPLTIVLKTNAQFQNRWAQVRCLLFLEDMQFLLYSESFHNDDARRSILLTRIHFSNYSTVSLSNCMSLTMMFYYLSELHIEVREVSSSQSLAFNESGFVFHPDLYLGLTIALKAAFVGPILLTNETNRFGPLHIEWMDDPTGCRPDEFSAFAPVAAPEELLILSTNPPLDEGLFCDGPEYTPRPFPVVSPSPTSSPSSSPSASPTSVSDGQLSALRAFYDSTYMHSNASRALHNWFDDDINSSGDYCSFTGITCEDGYVTRINLPHKELSGVIPNVISGLSRLTKLNLTGNR
jgi:hypothetical protein